MKTKAGRENMEAISMAQDTAPQLVRRNALLYGNEVAMRKKNFAIWFSTTWAEVYEHVKNIAQGFKDLGLEKGERVIIIGKNDPELFWCEWGAQSVGGVVTCLHVDSLPREIKYYIEDTEAKFFVGEGQEQIDKLIRIKDECPTIEKCIYWDPKGLWLYEEPYLLNLQDLEERGKQYGIEHPDFLDKSVDEGKKNDIALIIYSSGTTGEPKGIVFTYTTMFQFAKNGFTVYPIHKGDEYLSYASPAWLEQFFGIPIGVHIPLNISFAEELETVQDDIKDIGPAMLIYPPRMWESIARRINVRLSDSSRWKRALFNLAMEIGYKVVDYEEKKQKAAPLFVKIARAIVAPVLRQVRDQTGLSRAKVCLTAGAMVAPDLMRFFHALGVPLSSSYGISEVGILTGAPPERAKYDTIGPPYPQIEIRINTDNEALFRNPGMPLGYWNKQEQYDAKVKNGWFYSGDGVWLDDDGHAVFWDRMSEFVCLKGGTKFSPQFIETKLRFSLYLSDGFVFGKEDKDYLVAVVAIDYGVVGKWAESNHIPYTTFVELSQLPPVLDLLKEEIRKVNDSIPAGCRIKRYVSLHKEFDPDEAELTRTSKLRRNVLEERYKEIIDAMYAGKDIVNVEADVTYRDGRKGTVKASLVINTL